MAGRDVRAQAAMDRNAAVLRPKADALQARVRAILPRYRSGAASEIAVLPAGEPYLQRAPAIGADFLAGLQVV